jgi:hypothetical protein
MISIPNLTQKQKMLLDVMWGIEDVNQVNDFINALPYRDKIDARGLLEIAIQESFEYEHGLDDYKTLAIEAIDTARQR